MCVILIVLNEISRFEINKKNNFALVFQYKKRMRSDAEYPRCSFLQFVIKMQIFLAGDASSNGKGSFWIKV